MMMNKDEYFARRTIDLPVVIEGDNMKESNDHGNHNSLITIDAPETTVSEIEFIEDSGYQDFDHVFLEDDNDAWRRNNLRNTAGLFHNEGNNIDIDKLTRDIEKKQIESINKSKSSRPSCYCGLRSVLLIVSVVIIILLAVFLALWFSMKNLVQIQANAATISLDKIRFHEFSEDSVGVNVVGFISNAGFLSSSIGQTTIALTNEAGYTIINMPFNGVAIENGGGSFQIDAEVPISNKTLFGQLLQNLYSQRSIMFDFKGNSTVSLLGRNFEGIVLSKRINVDGLARMRDVEIRDFSIVNNATQVRLLARMTSQSPVEIDFGRTSLTAEYESTEIFNVTSSQFGFIRGIVDNELTGRLGSPSDLNSFMSQYANGNKIPISLKVPQQSNMPSYLRQTIDSVNVETTIPSDRKMSVQVYGVSFSGLGIKGLLRGENRTVSIDGFSLNYSVPSTIPFNVTAVSVSLEFTQGTSTVLTTTSSGWLPIKNGKNVLDSLDLKFNSASEQQLLKGIDSFMSSSNVPFAVKGTLGFKSTSQFGEIAILNQEFASSLRLDGLNNLQPFGSAVKSQTSTATLKFIDSAQDELRGEGIITFVNPSRDIEIDLSGIETDVLYGGVKIGTSTFNGLNLQSGNNVARFGFTVSRNASDGATSAIQTLFSALVATGSQTLNFDGGLIDDSLFRLNFNGVLDGATNTSTIKSAALTNTTLLLSFNDPFNGTFTVSSLSGALKQNDAEITSFASTYEQPRSLQFLHAETSMTSSIFTKSAPVSISYQMTLIKGQFETVVTGEQNDVNFV